MITSPEAIGELPGLLLFFQKTCGKSALCDVIKDT